MKTRITKIYGVYLRHILQSMHSLSRLFDTLFWPIVDLLIWGITGQYIQNSVQMPNILQIIISAIIFWMIVYRNQNLVTVSMLEDFWNKSFLHYFIAPVKFSEYILGIIAVAFTKLLITFCLSILVAWLLYQTTIFSLGFYLIPFVINLLLVGWWVAFFILGIILKHGSKVEILAWSFIAILSPFSAVYYPLQTLPIWAQKIAMFLPTSYIFEGMREVINTQSLDWNKIWISGVLNLFYLSCSIIFLKYSYKKVLEKGLVKVF